MAGTLGRDASLASIIAWSIGAIVLPAVIGCFITINTIIEYSGKDEVQATYNCINCETRGNGKRQTTYCNCTTHYTYNDQEYSVDLGRISKSNQTSIRYVSPNDPTHSISSGKYVFMCGCGFLIFSIIMLIFGLNYWKHRLPWNKKESENPQDPWGSNNNTWA